MSNPALTIHPLILGIIGLTALASLFSPRDSNAFRSLEFNIGRLKQGEYYRLLTSALIHVDFGHLAFNMITLFFFADEVIRYLGETYFLIIYICSALTGGLLSYFFHYQEDQYRAVGASGAVTGILYAAILLEPGLQLYIMPIPFPIPSYVFGIGYLFYSLYGMKSRMDNIGHSAHFGGAVGGYILTLIMVPTLFQTHLNMVLLMAVPIAVLFFLPKGRQ